MLHLGTEQWFLGAAGKKVTNKVFNDGVRDY